MESPDLNSPSESEDRLDGWLREGGAEVSDHGFSTRVLSALPPPVRHENFSRRWLICAVAALVGVIVAWPRVDSWNEVTSQVVSWSDGLMTASSRLTNPMIGLAFAAAGLSLIAVFWRGDRQPD